MNKKLILNLICALGIFTSCAEFLDPYPYGRLSEEDFWKRQDAVQGLIGQCYDYMKRDYNNNEGYYLDGATDDAVITSSTHDLSKLSNGSLTTGNKPFDDSWKNAYKAIASVNKFLKDDRGLNTRYLVDAHLDSLVRYRLQGEAYALRAWFQWDLLKLWGGKGIESGEMLGFPIVTETFNIFDDEINLARNTYEECVKQIEADCDSAFKYLPIAHRDFLQDKGDLNYAGGRYWGRMDGITTVAIKSNMYLTWASPLFNPSNDKTRWEKSARFAKEVIDFKLTVDNVTAGFAPKNRVAWTNPNFPGIIYSSRYNNNNDAMERALYPKGFQGNAVIGATQELVDAFPMKNGYPKEHPEGAKLFDPQNPYSNRDARFYSAIFYNGAKANRDNNTSKPMYTFESWINTDGSTAKDASGQNATSLTNFHVKKYIYMGLNWGDASIKKQPHSKFYIRWAHMILNFAEAANEFEGATGGSFGLSAKDAMKMLRERKTYDNKDLYSSNDPYLNEVSVNTDLFRTFVRNERRIETCFEGMRFFDIRRWATDISELNQPVHKALINKDESGDIHYNKEVIRERVYESLYIPIPYVDILRMSNLEQNEGWNNWI